MEHMHPHQGNGDSLPTDEVWSETRRIADAKLKALDDDELKQRLFIELEGHVDEEGRAKVSAAFLLAESVHHDQLRSPGTHMSHAFRNAIRIAHYFEIRDPDVIAAALLHDSVEDQSKRIVSLIEKPSHDEAASRQRALEIIEEYYGIRTAEMIAGVTTPEYAGPPEGKNQFYLEFVTQQVEDPRFFVLKLSDFIDNAVGLQHTNSAALRARLAVKYEPLFDVFLARLYDPDIPLSDEARDRVRDQLLEARERNREYVDDEEQVEVGV